MFCFHNFEIICSVRWKEGGAPGSQPFDLGLKCIYAGLIDIDEL